MASNIDRENMVAWGQHYRVSGPLLYPDERIVCFLATEYPNRDANKRRKALDIGFGSGRHVQLLLDYGFEVHGIDYNKEAVEIAKQHFAGREQVGSLLVGSLEEPPYGGETFDVIIAYGIMFLRPLEKMERDLRIIKGLLKSGGKMIVNFRTKDNWFFGKGVRYSDETYHLGPNAGPYHGMHYTFLDESRATSLLVETGFKIINSERLDLWKENQSKQHSWNIFWVQKV